MCAVRTPFFTLRGRYFLTFSPFSPHCVSKCPIFTKKDEKILGKFQKPLFFSGSLYYNDRQKNHIYLYDIFSSPDKPGGKEKSFVKQKYTITISDVEMNVICDETPETVESIVANVDRRIREINLKSPRCSKNEAALLCALDLCTERLSLQSQLTEMESQNDKLFRALEKLQRENESLTERLAAAESAAAAAAAASDVAPAEDASAEAASAESPALEAPAAEPAPSATPVDNIVRKKKTVSFRSAAATRAKNKVGNMFETLTFHDDE